MSSKPSEYAQIDAIFAKVKDPMELAAVCMCIAATYHFCKKETDEMGVSDFKPLIEYMSQRANELVHEADHDLDEEEKTK